MVQNNLSLEERIHLQKAAVAFASYVTGKYPQINEDKQLNYYISGSLSVMLLAQVDSMDLLDPSKLPDISIKKTRRLNKKLVSKLEDFTRQIGDFDYVETEAYRDAKDKTIPRYEMDPEGYVRERGKFLFKGGGGPSIEELPDLARDILEYRERAVKVMCDPMVTQGKDRVVRIKLKDKYYFIPDPTQIFAYKVLNLLEKFDNEPDKFKRDFPILKNAFLNMYAEEQLIRSAYEVIVKSDNALGRFGYPHSKNMRKLENNPQLTSNIKDFFRKIKQYDAGHGKILQTNS